MKRSYLVLVLGIIIAVGGGVFLLNNREPGGEAVADGSAAAAAMPASTSAAAAPMQSTGKLFVQSADYNYAHKVYPIPSADAAQALGAFSVATSSAGNGATRVTLTNGAEGYSDQSVIVLPGQTVYFVERSSRDDTATEDSGTRDDYLVAVDAQGMVLQ